MTIQAKETSTELQPMKIKAGYCVERDGHLHLKFVLDVGMKRGRFNHLLETVDPNAVNRSVGEKDMAMMQTTLQSMFRPEQHRLLSTSVCLFTNTPDLHFIIDRHPLHPQVQRTSCMTFPLTIGF